MDLNTSKSNDSTYHYRQRVEGSQFASVREVIIPHAVIQVTQRVHLAASQFVEPVRGSDSSYRLHRSAQLGASVRFKTNESLVCKDSARRGSVVPKGKTNSRASTLK